MIKNKEAVQFVDYVFDFYGPKGIYPLGASKHQIYEATLLHCHFLEKDGREFYGDTMDREMVRSILETEFGLSEKQEMETEADMYGDNAFEGDY